MSNLSTTESIKNTTPFNGLIGKITSKLHNVLKPKGTWNNTQARMAIALNTLPFYITRMKMFELPKENTRIHYKQLNKIKNLISKLSDKYIEVPDAEKFIWGYLRKVFNFSYYNIPTSRYIYIISFLQYLLDEPNKILLPIAIPTETILTKNNLFFIYCEDYHYVFPFKTLFIFDVNIASFFKFRSTFKIEPVLIPNIKEDTQFLSNPGSFVTQVAKSFDISYLNVYKLLGIPLSITKDNKLYINKLQFHIYAQGIYYKPIIDRIRRNTLENKILHTDTRRLNLYFIWDRYRETKKREYAAIYKRWLNIANTYLRNSVHKDYFLKDTGESIEAFVFYTELKHKTSGLLQAFNKIENTTSKRDQKEWYNIYNAIIKYIEDNIGFSRKLWTNETYKIALSNLDGLEIQDIKHLI